MSASNSLNHVLRLAQAHPFYQRPSAFHSNAPQTASISNAGISSWQDVEGGPPLATSSTSSMPPSAEVSVSLEITKQPLLHKDNLYKTIQRLLEDVSPENKFRHSSYISTTGGGSGKGLPMIFLTDFEENQSQRIGMGKLMKACGLVEPRDLFLNLHPSGFLYRALDLTSQSIEQAGGSVLCAGHLFPNEKSFDTCIKYHVNVITSDTSHMLNFAHHVSTLPPNERAKLTIQKVIYTCEMMPRAKREYLSSIFGSLSFYSMFASAETGPWAVADLNYTNETEDDSSTDFLYDTRAMHVEVLSLNSEAFKSKSSDPPQASDLLADGKKGHLVLTSLQRFKNPLVRYVSGDIGSVNPLPESAYPRISISVRPYLKVLRLYGRDQRFSFKWTGEYFALDELNKVMETKEWGILQWQVIIENDTEWEGSDSLQLRLLRREDETTVSREELMLMFRDVFFLTEINEKLWSAVFLDDVSGFVQSETSTKVVPVIDRTRH